MAIGKILVSHFGESLPIEEDEFQTLSERIDQDVQSTGGRLGAILNSPYLLLILPFLLPLIVQLYDWAVQKFVPQPEEQEDGELKAALEVLTKYLQQK